MIKAKLDMLKDKKKGDKYNVDADGRLTLKSYK